MSECLPDLPRHVRQTPEGFWIGADHPDGPWRAIPAPQSGLPWRTPPATEESSAPQPTPTDRMAPAVCVAELPSSKPCRSPCNGCRVNSAAVAREIARQLRERHGGSSQVADWLDGVGAHP